jgi:flagellar protein FlaG
MDVSKISQGGPISFDNTNIKAESLSPVQSDQPQVAIKDVSTDKNTKKVVGLTDKTSPVSDKELKKALDKLTSFLSDDNTKVEYSFHDKFNDLMIKITNKDTNEVILEVPPKKILDLVAKMMEMVGILFDKKA